MDKRETEIEKALIKIVESHNGMCLKWVCPGWAGVPDRICFIPGGRVYLVETKRPRGGKLSERQRWWRTRFFHLGCFYALVDDDEALKAFNHLLDVEDREARK